MLAAEKNADSTLSETLQRYEDLSGHVKVSYVNPSTNPTFFQKYTTDAPTSNSLIVASDARSRVIDYNDIYESTPMIILPIQEALMDMMPRDRSQVHSSM